MANEPWEFAAAQTIQGILDAPQSATEAIVQSHHHRSSTSTPCQLSSTAQYITIRFQTSIRQNGNTSRQHRSLFQITRILKPYFFFIGSFQQSVSNVDCSQHLISNRCTGSSSHSLWTRSTLGPKSEAPHHSRTRGFRHGSTRCHQQEVSARQINRDITLLQLEEQCRVGSRARGFPVWINLAKLSQFLPSRSTKELQRASQRRLGLRFPREDQPSHKHIHGFCRADQPLHFNNNCSGGRAEGFLGRINLIT